jgi:hypothetical protein
VREASAVVLAARGNVTVPVVLLTDRLAMGYPERLVIGLSEARLRVSSGCREAREQCETLGLERANVLDGCERVASAMDPFANKSDGPRLTAEEDRAFRFWPGPTVDFLHGTVVAAILALLGLPLLLDPGGPSTGCQTLTLLALSLGDRIPEGGDDLAELVVPALDVGPPLLLGGDVVGLLLRGRQERCRSARGRRRG